MRHGFSVCLIAASVLVGCVAAEAQSSPPANTGHHSRWEVEVHGVETRSSVSGGTETLPPPGQPFTDNGPIGISRSVSSWYFGDGALLLNQAAAPFNNPLVVPLDPVLQSSVVKPGRGGIGFRIGRELTKRLMVEFAFDYGGGLTITDSGVAGIEATRASFQTAWMKALGTGSTVTSVSTLHPRQGHQLFTTGALLINLPGIGRVRPYVTIGGGVVSNSGGTPDVTLVGTYQYQFQSLPPISETETVKLRYTLDDRSFVRVFGGGVKYFVSSRWGVRADARGQFHNDPISNLVDANPAPSPSQTGVIFVPAGQAGVAIFANPPVGVKSSLSGPAIEGFKTFSGSGIQAQLSIAVGLFWRF